VSYTWSGTPTPASVAAPNVTLGVGTHTFSLIVTDNRGAQSAASSVTITVNAAVPANQAPVANAGSNQTVTLPQGQSTTSVTLNGSGTDPDGSIASYTWSGTPTPAAIAAPNVTLGVGTHTFSLIVTDNQGAQSASSSVTITVNAAVPANQAPVANAGSNQTLTLPQGQSTTSVTLNGSGTDPDGSIASYTWSGIPQPATVASPSITLGVGIHTFTLVVTDNQGAQSAVSTVTVTVNPAPALAPIILTQSLPVGRVGSGYIGGISASDPAGATLTYALDQGPTGMTINSNSGLLNWLPVAVDVGTAQIVVSVSNSKGMSTRQTFTVTIPDTIAPSISFSSPPTQVLQGSTTVISAIATDNRGITSVSFSVNGAAPTIVTTQPYQFSLNATQVPGTTLVVRAVAEDTSGNMATVEANITVYIINGNNHAPQLGPLDATYTVAEGGTLTIPVTGTDPDTGDVVALVVATTPPSLAHATFNAGIFTFSPDFTQAGSYSVTFRAVDPFGLTDQKTIQISVTDVNRPPLISTQSLANGKVDFIYSATIAASDPDNDPLAFSLSQGPTGMTINPTSGVLNWRPVIGDIGSHTVAVSVNDGKGGIDTKQYTLHVPDSVPPSVSLSAPSEAIPGAIFKVVATAADNKAVTLVTIAVAGQPSVDLTTAPYELQVTLPDALAVGSLITISATAKDAAGNSSTTAASVKIVAVPDTVPPTVTLTAPTTVAAGSRITISAVASDSQGVAKLDFYADGVAIGSSAAATPSATYVVPANAVVAANITFSVTATDFSGNSASAQATSTVVAAPVIPDTTPPTVNLNAPSSIAIGSLLPVTISAGDDKGIASVELLLAHNRVAYFTTAVSQTVNLPLPDVATVGMELIVELQAFDLSGNPASASSTVTVVTRGQGVLTGAVYDDSTGLPLPGATVRLALNGQPEQTVTTDSHGHYSLVAAEGSGGLNATKAGYNRVDRSPAIIFTNTGRRITDIRLTPLPANGTSVSAVLGGTVSASFSAAQAGIASAIKEAGIITIPTGAITIDLPSGALSAEQNLTLVQVGAQGLQGSLTSGWSPVAAFDLNPHGITFAVPAAARVPNLLGLSAASGAVVARWDELNSIWQVVGAATVAADGLTLGSNISTSGQYAFLVPDMGSSQTTPAAGAPLPAIPLLPPGLDLQAQVTPQPKLIFYKPGVSSAVGSRIAAAKPLVSGTAIWANIVEDYQFYSGDRIVAEPYAQDIVLYTFGLPAGALLADYPVSPGQDFTGQLLEKGVISVTTSIPPANADFVTVVGPQGGAISAAGGEALIIPAGAVTRTVPVVIKPFDLTASGLTLPPGFTLLGGVTFSIPGAALQLPAELSLPLPVGFAAAGDVLLVRPIAIGGSTHLEIIGRGTVNSGRLLSTREVPGSSTALFPGITGEGSVFFIQSVATYGYAGGIVTGTGNSPFSGALISSVLPLVATSSVNGTYVTAVPPGGFTLTALDTVKMDKGTSSGTVSAGTFAALNLSLAIEAPTVISVAPANSAINVALTDPVVVKLSEPVVAAGPANVQVTSGAAGATVIVNGSVELSVDGTTVTFRHSDLFASNTLYTVTVNGLTDRSGTTMAVPFASTFTSLNTDPPVAPPAGSVTATIPGTDGKTTVSGTQGSAGLHDTVTIVNLTTGARNPALVDPNGSFSTTFAATVKDKLQLEITSPAGVTTTVPLPRFRQTNADGSISEVVGTEGGTVVGPEGIQVDIPAGAFDAPALIRLKPVTEAAFPVQLSDTDKQTFAFSGGIDLDLGAEQPKKYLNISIPVKGGETSDDQWVLTKISEQDGVKFMHPVDTARVINNSIRTSSPPCPGVIGSAVYGFLKSSTAIGVVYGRNTSAGFITTAQVILANQNILLPYSLQNPGVPDTASDIAKPFCIPVPAGRATVTLNTIPVTVRKSEFTDIYTEIVITNPSPQLGAGGLTWRFPGNQLEFTVKATGTMTDTFTLSTVDSTGVVALLGATAYKTVQSETAGFVEFKIPFGTVPVNAETLRINNTTSPGVTSVPVSSLPVVFQISGGVSDSAITVVGKVPERGSVLAHDAILSRDGLAGGLYGTGRLILQVLPRTIDPTQAQIDAYNSANPTKPPIIGPAVVNIDLFEGTTLVKTFDPVADTTVLVNGGMTQTFDGDPSAPHSLEVTYDDGKKITISIAVLTLTVRATSTNPAAPAINRAAPARLSSAAPVKVISVSVPPVNHPMVLPLLVDGDKTLSVIQPADLNFFDPVTELLTFTFSRSMDVPTMYNVHIDMFDASGNLVKGELRVSDDNTKITFVPLNSLSMGSTYTINLSGLMDKDGNPQSTKIYKITTVTPNRAALIDKGENPTRTLEPLNDLAIAGNNPIGGNLVYGVADLPSGPGFKFMAFSPKPGETKEIGHATGGGYKKRVYVEEGIVEITLRKEPPCTGAHITGPLGPDGSYSFKGRLAIGISSSSEMSSITFYDITQPTNICVLGGKLLTTASTNLTAYTSGGTLHSISLVTARGVATVKSPGKLMSYVALDSVGVMAVDVGGNIPEVGFAERQLEAVYPGSFRDIVAISDRLFVADHDAQQLTMLDPNLFPVTVFPLKSKPRRMVYAGTVARDLNQNGNTADPGEQLNLLFVGEEGCLEVIDVSNPALLSSRGTIVVPGNTTALDVDWNRLSLFVITDSKTLSYYNIGSIWDNSFFDGRNNKIWQNGYLAGTSANSVKVDPNTGDVYVATAVDSIPKTGALEVWKMGGQLPNLTGYASYTFYEAKPALGLDWDNPKQLPIRGAPVELVEDTPEETVVAKTNTDGTGHFAFIGAPENKNLKIRISAALGNPSGPRVRVVDYDDCVNIKNKALSACDTMKTHPFPVKIPVGGKLFANMSTNQKTPSSVFFTFMSTFYRRNYIGPTYNERDASPFAIIDTIYHGEQFLRREVASDLEFPPYLVAFDIANAKDTSNWNREENLLYIKGNERIDSDEYDRIIILHEWMHYISTSYFRSDSVGGYHYYGEQLDPTLAFNEGFGNAFAAMVNGSSEYVDTTENGRNGGAPGCKANGDGTLQNDKCDSVERDYSIKNNSGIFCEWCVTEILWDLFDPPDAGLHGPPDDPDNDQFLPLNTKSDEVQISFAKLYNAALKMKTKPAFNTIVTYLYDILGELPKTSADRRAVLKIAEAEGINFSFDEPAAVGGEIKITEPNTYDLVKNKLYNEVTIGTLLDTFNNANAGQVLSTSDKFDQNAIVAGNKFDEYLYFKFTVSKQGIHNITLTPKATDTWFMGYELIYEDEKKNRQKISDESLTSGSYKITTPVLVAGDCFMRVKTIKQMPSGEFKASGPEIITVLVEGP
jgi:hypothetical protein